MNSTDGFLRRRTNNEPPRLNQRPRLENKQLESFRVPQNSLDLKKKTNEPVQLLPNSRRAFRGPQSLGESSQQQDLRLDIEDIIHGPDEQTSKKGWFGRRKKQDSDTLTRPRLSRKKLILRSLAGALVVMLLAGGYFGWNIWRNTGKVFQGNVLNALIGGNKPLKTDQYGRSNILIFGTSEDDPNHPGADLTDSIMFISVDQKKNDAFIISVPRDLWVKIPNCSQFSQQKINAVYECFNGSMGQGNETDGQTALRTAVAKTFGVDLQYSMHVNYAVLKDSIDALGGVDITISSPDPRGILDRNFDWRCGYKCYLVKWPNGPAHLDGTHALYLAQARNDAGGYGLPKGNFDREANQRKIMLAAKDKATSIGFLANPVAVNNLLNSLGDNLRTNIDAGEIKTFLDVVKKTDSKNINSVSLVDQTPAIFATDTGPDGSSIVRPVKGLYDYSDLIATTKAYLSGNGKLLSEATTVDVLNATGVAGEAKKEADILTASGIGVGALGNAPTGDYGKVKLYDLTKGDKPATKQKLEELLGVTATAEPLPAGIKSTASFVVVVGQTVTAQTTDASNSSAASPSASNSQQGQ